MPAHGIPFEVEVDVHVFAEATRVVVSIGLGVSECFQDAIRLQQNVLHSEEIWTILIQDTKISKILR